MTQTGSEAGWSRAILVRLLFVRHTECASKIFWWRGTIKYCRGCIVGRFWHYKASSLRAFCWPHCQRSGIILWVCWPILRSNIIWTILGLLSVPTSAILAQMGSHMFHICALFRPACFANMNSILDLFGIEIGGSNCVGSIPNNCFFGCCVMSTATVTATLDYNTPCGFLQGR